MRERERESFNLGDIVRIREWDDMKREFGIDGDSIDCRFSFIPDMRELCGEQFVISDISEDGRVIGHDFDFTISTDMIKLVNPYRRESSEDTSAIENYLSEYKRN